MRYMHHGYSFRFRLTTRGGRFQALLAVLPVWNAFFFPARFRHHAVAEILPHDPMRSQVDLNGHLAAFSSVKNWIPVMVLLSFRLPADQ
jgi:hypothetical protein